MPKFKPGDQVRYIGADGYISVQDFEKSFGTGPITIKSVGRGDWVGLSVNGRSLSCQDCALALAGPPTTVREMSYKILREVGYATV